MENLKNSSIKILVVDDEPDLLLIAERLLKKENYDVSTATSGQGCLDAVNLNKPDLLILDVMLPDINGVEICKIIKANPNLASIYIFLISGFKINTESISEGLELGADGYLIKPIKNREILARVESAVRIIRTEKALRKSEEEFRSLAESMPQIVWITRADGWNIYFNQQWVDYTGLSLEESYGHGWNKPFHPEDQQRAWDAWQNAVNNNGTYSIEVRLRRFDGEYFWWLVRGVPQIDEKGKIQKWYGTCTDIEEIKRSEEALRQSEMKMRRAIENSPFPIMIHAENGEVVMLSNAWTDITGYTHSDIPTIRDWTEKAYGNKNELVREEIDRLYNITERVYEGYYEITIHDGTKRIWEFMSAALGVLPDGRRMAISMAIDQTERKHIEDALRETQAILQAAMDQSTAGIAIANAPNGELRYVNKAGLFIRGSDNEEVVKDIDINQYVSSWHILGLDGIPLQPEEVPLARAVLFGEENSREFIIRRSKDDDRIVFANAAPIRDDKGIVVAGIVVFQDITERKQAEILLRASEVKFKTLVENIPQKVFMKDLDYKWTFVNKNFANGLEINPEEALGKIDTDFFPPELAAKYREDDERIIKSGQTDEIQEKYLERGEERWVNTVKTAIKDGNDKIIGLLGISWDITDRKRTEEEIQRQLDELRRWYEVTLDREGRVIELKQEVNELLKKHGEALRYGNNTAYDTDSLFPIE